MNLISNAIKYASNKPIGVTVRRDGADVIVRVDDNGPGIAETHGGTATASNHPSGGASFTVRLP